MAGIKFLMAVYTDSPQVIADKFNENMRQLEWLINGGYIDTTMTTFNKIAAQVDSTAPDVATLKADFNSFLAKLRASGLMDT